MKTKKRIILKALAAAVVLTSALLIGVNVFLMFYDVDGLKPAIMQTVSRATGRKLTIGGHLYVKPGAPPTFIAEEVGFENADWGWREHLVRTKRIEIKLALVPLLWGRYHFYQVTLVAPEVSLELSRSGISNVHFETVKKPSGNSKPGRLILTFGNIRIRDGFFSYRDERDGKVLQVKLPTADGKLGLDFSDERPRISVGLSLKKTEVSEKAVSSSRKNPATPVKPENRKRDRIFSKTPWDLDGFRKIDGEFDLKADQLAVRNNVYDRLDVHATLKDGSLIIEPVRVKVGPGSAEAVIRLATKDQRLSLQSEAKADRFRIDAIPSVSRTDQRLNGELDGSARLTASGDSAAELMGRMNGGIILSVKDGTTHSEILKAIQRYLGTNLLRLVNPFDQDSELTRINCFTGSMIIKEGVADCKLMLDTQQSALIVAGHIDLKTEALDIAVQPTPKKGEQLGILDSISVGLHNLSDPFRVGGTLAHPRMTLDPGDTLFTVGKFAGAFALGPAGFALLITDISLGKTDLCEESEKALGDTKIELDHMAGR